MIEVVYLISRAKKTAGPVNQALNILIGLNSIPNVHARLVTLAPEMKDFSWLQRFKDNNIEVVQLKQPIWLTWRCIPLLKKFIKKNNIDIVHSAGYRADFVNMFLRNDVKTVTTQRSLPNEFVEKFPKLLKPIFENIHLWIIKRMGRIVACSESMMHTLRSDYNLDAYAVQNGVNTDLFVPVDKKTKEELRIKLGFKSNSLLYLVLGSLRPRKNVGLIIDAFRTIDNPDIELAFVGDGPLREELEKKADGDSRIHFIGVTGRPKDYLQASDILISSALAEGLPNTVLEAFACGLPCVLSDIGPHKELLRNSKIGVLFKCNNLESLKECLKESLSWDVQKMSNDVRLEAEEAHSVNALAENYLKIYKSLIPGKNEE